MTEQLPDTVALPRLQAFVEGIRARQTRQPLEANAYAGDLAQLSQATEWATGWLFEDRLRREEGREDAMSLGTAAKAARARYAILQNDAGQPMLIRDLGPWDKHPTVTNDAERVVAELMRSRLLQPGQRLFYIDSDERRDELVIRDGKFFGFAPGNTVSPFGPKTTAALQAATAIFRKYREAYDGEVQGCCPLIADEIARATGGVVVAGYLCFGGVERPHWWVDVNGLPLDPMGDYQMSHEKHFSRREAHRDQNVFQAILPDYEKWRVA